MVKKIETREKIKVAAPYVDRKSREYEVVPPDPLCPRCMRSTTWRENEGGELQRWCFNCSTPG